MPQYGISRSTMEDDAFHERVVARLDKLGGLILTIPCLGLNLEPPRALLGHVNRNPTVGLRPHRPYLGLPPESWST